MLNTLFGRNWDTQLPILDVYPDKVMLSDGEQSFYVQKDLVKAYTNWGSSLGLNMADLIYILNMVEIKGWINYVGNFDKEDNSFVVFTTSSVYFARLDHGNDFSNVALRIAEEYNNRTVEKNYYISRSMASGMINVLIDACKIKNSYGMMRADYTFDPNNACASLKIRRERIDYDVDILCKRKNNHARIIENGSMRSNMEMFFMNIGLEGALDVYHVLVQEFFEDGILPEDIEVIKIKTYQNSQFVSEVYFEKCDLKMISFIDHDEFWRLKSDGSWDFVQDGDVIFWKWREKNRDFELVSNFDEPLNSDECTSQTLEYAYAVNKATAYLNSYFGT